MPRQRVKIPTRWQGGILGASFSGSGLVEVSGQAVWNLPDTISIQPSGTVNLRQYAVNADGWQIVVSNLPAGVTYNSGTESLEGAASGASGGTAIFTLTRIGGSDVVDTATVVFGAGYTLANAIAGLPFAISTPTPPTITNEQVVTDANIGTYINTNGLRLILTAGSYGDLTFGAQDQEIVLTTGVTIGTLSIASTARRLHFRADPVRSGRIYRVDMGTSFVSSLVTDILWDGLYVDDTGNPSQNSWCGTRIAVINSEVRGDSYAGANFHNITDFIWGNCLIHTYGMTQANVRSHSALRYAIVDSRLMKTGSANHTLRIHADNDLGARPADYIYIGRNQLDGARTICRGDGNAPEFDGTAAATPGINNVWFEDNALYNPGPNSASFYTGDALQDSDRPQMLYLRRNTLYTDYNTWYAPSAPRAGWVDEGNTHLPYQAPPSWSFA